MHPRDRLAHILGKLQKVEIVGKETQHLTDRKNPKEKRKGQKIRLTLLKQKL